ncbi:MAG: hypothetical protein Q9202_000476 [Teloschistes flavicans]
MLGWLSGAAQRGAIQSSQETHGSSYIEESPETPAPVFAVRAFKTALFGTPHANPHDDTVIEPRNSLEQPGKKHSPKAKLSTPRIASKLHPSRAIKATPLISPAKGILLTPGTANTRRKTVSFGNLDIDGGANPGKSPPALEPTSAAIEDIEEGSAEEKSKKDQPAPFNLTKASFETQLIASKHRLGTRQEPIKEIPKKDGISSEGIISSSNASAQPDAADTTIDFTVDLTKPRSQSGQHWKAEYERYQKNSDRELKNVIQHEQNVKSYAEKKDAEATELQEKLKRELAKCAAMESKVTKLATQLSGSKGNRSEESSEQETLMNDLSRQTALAIKYKRKVDRYRAAIQRQKLSSVDYVYAENPNDTTIPDLDGAPKTNDPSIQKGSELIALRTELDTMRSKLDSTEERATELEAVNAKLKRNFLRVKNEMENYDGRRVRREARLKEREDKLVAEKVACEANLEQLKKKHEEVLRSLGRRKVVSDAQDPLVPMDSNRQRSHSSRPSVLAKAAQTAEKTSNLPSIDIWTMNSPNDTANTTPSAAEPAINLSSIAISEATHQALREIDNNSVPDYASEPPLPPDTPRPTMKHLAEMDSALQPDFPSSAERSVFSASKRMNDRRHTIASPRPSMVSMALSAVKVRDTPRARSEWRRAPNLASAAAESRRSTLNGGRSRVGDLPPDRAAAAKARLAQRKNLKENRH